MLVITVAATRSYLHAWPQCVRAIAAAAGHHEEAHFVLATDESKEGKMAEEIAKNELPEGWKVTVLRLPIKEDEKDYKETAQLRIAALQGACFSFARKIRATQCLVVESDTILPAHALRVLEWTLQMPKADGSPYYQVAAATYPNGLFLGGFGSYQHPIAEDFLPEERIFAPRLKLCLEQCESRLKSCTDQKIGEREMKRLHRLRERIKQKPPTGNVFELNAKGYRRRGWMDFAYPGIGLGAVVPTEWCGLGCTLLSKEALLHADFTGYDGRGTQDLFLCWHRWHPAGMNLAIVPHVACDHIKHRSQEAPVTDPEIIHYRAFHEPEGECKGHLRQRPQPFISV